MTGRMSRASHPSFTCEYPRRESNSHVRGHNGLNVAWLPLHHSGKICLYSERESNPQETLGLNQPHIPFCYRSMT